VNGGPTRRERVRRQILRGGAAVLRRRAPVASMPPRKILLIRPDHLGDVLWLTPALRALRRGLPDATLAVAIGPWSRPILAANGDYDDLLVLDFPGFTRRPKGGALAPYRTLRAAAAELRARGFDTAIVLRDDHWWGGLLAATAGIPRRLGFAHPDVAPFLTEALPLPVGEHVALGDLRLIDAVLRDAGGAAILPDARAEQEARVRHPLVFASGAAADARAAAILAPLGASAAPIVAIHASAGVPVKLWDEGRLAAVADGLAREFGARIVLTGGARDEALTGAVAAAMETAPPLDLTGRTTIPELVALYGRCALVLGPDSGALHLAVASGTPTLHLYGPADPVRFGPWGDPAWQRVVSAGRHCDRCGDLSPDRPRGAACMLAIEAEQVLAAARELLAARGPARV
jgi:heptosyltransferase-3